MANVYKTMSLQKLQSIDSLIYFIMCVCEDLHKHRHTYTNTSQNTETQNDIWLGWRNAEFHFELLD